MDTVIAEIRRGDLLPHGPGAPGFAEAIVATSGALICVLDRRGRIVAFNPACERATGYTFPEVRGRLFWDLFLTADELARVRAVFADLCAGRFPNEHENQWRTRDGRLRLIAWANTATLDADGAVEYVVATGIDVTERRAAEAAARERAAQLALVTAQLPAHVWTTDRDLRLTSFTGGGFAGRDAETGARLGLTLAQFFRTADPDHPPIAAHRRALAGEPAGYEITVDGREYEVRVEPLRDEARAIVGCVGLGVDVTERRAAELRGLRARPDRHHPGRPRPPHHRL
jgi:PAS domain S-box-containing protein